MIAACIVYKSTNVVESRGEEVEGAGSGGEVDG